MFKSKKMVTLLTASILLGIGGWQTIGHSSLLPAVNASRTRQTNHYKIQSANYRDLRIVKHNATLWQRPNNVQIKSVSNMNKYSHTNQLVHLNLQAKLNGKVRYFQIGRQGRTLGWVRPNDLRFTKKYVLPYRYISQFWPSHVNDACEAAALMMALSAKGKGMHISLHHVVKRIPRSTNPNYGYTHNPYKLGTGASIYPRALAQVSRRQFHIRAKGITGASKRNLIHDIKHGNPVVFEGSYRMRNTKSDHSLVLLGYKPGYFYFADPYSKHRGRIIDGWVNTHQFMQIFTARKRGSRAVLIY